MNNFKVIVGYENYMIGDKGTIINIKTEKKKALTLDRDGYSTVSLWRNNKEKNYKVHRLVGEYFVDGYFEGAVINHKDEIKSNNNFENLEWVTIKYNNNYNNKPMRVSKQVNMYSIDGKYIQSFNSLKEVGITLGLCVGNLSSHLNGRQKTFGGYIFKYCIDTDK